MKRRGNFIKFMIIITSDVISVGFAAINRPSEEPKIDIRTIPKNIKNIPKSEVNTMENSSVKISAIIDVIISEYRDEAITIPINISFNDMGETKIRSSDFSRVSIGNTTGLIAVAVKNDVIDIIPINT